MNVRFSIDDPGDMKASVTITLTVNQWRELMRQLPNTHPAWQLGSAIADVVKQAEKHFYSEHKAE